MMPALIHRITNKHIYLLGICVSLFVFVLPNISQAFYVLNTANGGDCSQIGVWEDTTSTCTLTTDIDEHVIIQNTNITLDGNGHTLDVTGQSQQYAVRADDISSVTVQNLVIKGSGIWFDQVTDAKAINNEIHDALIAIHFFDLGTAYAEGNTIIDTDTYNTAAISASVAHNINIQNNHITGGEFGIRLDQVSSAQVTENQIKSIGIGLDLTRLDNSDLTNNVVTDANIAIELQTDESDGNFISNNTFEDSQLVAAAIKADFDDGPVLSRLFDWWQWLGVVARHLVVDTALAQTTGGNIFTKNNFINNNEDVEITGPANVEFSTNLPEGGNYWDVFDEVGEGCVDGDSDGFCDTFYDIGGSGYEDDYPHTNQISITLPDPECSDGVDNDSDGATDYPDDTGCGSANDRLEVNPPAPTCTLVATPDTIDQGATTTLTWTSQYASDAAIDNAIGSVGLNGNIEVNPADTTTYTATFSGSGGSVDCQATVTVQGPQPQTLGEKAAALAKLVVTAPYLGDGDTYGGKGWDPNAGDRGRFVSPDKIFRGYNYWNNKIKAYAFGSGLDCSGLVMWSFNSANDPEVSHNNNVVLQEGANGQYLHNLEPDVVDQIKPGDLLFFSHNGDPDAFKDHVAMYVGGSGSNSIVEAASPAEGIIYSDIDEKVDDADFIDQFRRLEPAVPPKVQVEVESPVDLIVTDPSGIAIGPDTYIQTDLEYLREVPGEWYYSEMIQGEDGRPGDWVYSHNLKDGVYTIGVIPDETATSGSTYSLTFTAGDNTIELAIDELVSAIPPQGFAIQVSDEGDQIEVIEVPETTVKELFKQLRSQVKDADVDHRFVARILKLQVSSAKKLYNKDRIKASLSQLKKIDRFLDWFAAKDLIETADAEVIQKTIAKLITTIKSEHE